jgi:PTH2 family peptidyl-tRNA hydrolase
MKVLLDECYRIGNRIEFSRRGKGSNTTTAWPELIEWLDCGFTKICVRADSLKELLDVGEKAKEANLPVAVVVDSGKTEFHGASTITCLAIGPAESEEIDKITGELKLL